MLLANMLKTQLFFTIHQSADCISPKLVPNCNAKGVQTKQDKLHSLVQAKQGCHAANDAHFDSNQTACEGQDNGPLLKQQAQVQTAASCDKEETQQDASEGAYVSFNLQWYSNGLQVGSQGFN